MPTFSDLLVLAAYCAYCAIFFAGVTFLFRQVTGTKKSRRLRARGK